MPCARLTRDFHCVTTWSVKDVVWGGIRAREIAERASPHPETQWVIAHGRDEWRVERTLIGLREEVPGARVEGVVADFASLARVRELAETIGQRHPRLDVLLNNAGTYEKARRLSEDGYELTLAVNHLAPFLLTRLLQGPLRAASPSRVVTVASVAHTAGRIDFDDLQLARSYSAYQAYANSKLANVMFACGLARRVEADGITSNSLHPGVINTKMLYAGFGAYSGAPVEAGSKMSVRLCLADDLATVTGRYFQDGREKTPSRAAADRSLQERLWEVTERLVDRAVGCA